ncbi:unnamed protein product [Rotaria sp. Silwood2]|nr:unnamed protein product [Rotaria sp. Silwood2]
MTYNCKGRSLCENQGRYLYNEPECSVSSMCMCNECSYGSRCQFSTKRISLDIILGYQIRPNLSLSQQHSSIKMTTIIVTIMLISGLVSSIFSIMTFHTRKKHEVGCDYYFLVSSYAFLIKVLMNISDCLNACVGINRSIAASQESNFNKSKHKRIAKWIITTNLQDPIYHRLIDDKEEHRT